jgi:hypothetical protein
VRAPSGRARPSTARRAQTTVADRVREIQNRYGPDHLVTHVIRQAWRDLKAAVERTERRLDAAGIAHA